jgi:bifunctional non-homologous end joining protein LigD
MYAFDLMYLDGHDMRKAPLVTRKAALALVRGSNILMSQSFEAGGAHMFETACAMGWRASSRNGGRADISRAGPTIG